MIFLTITLVFVLFYFELYGSGRPQRLRKVNAILLTGAFVWFLANFGLSFELNTMPIVSRIFLFNSFVLYGDGAHALAVGLRSHPPHARHCCLAATAHFVRGLE